MTEHSKVVPLPRVIVQPPKDLRALVEDLAAWRHKPIAHTQLFIVDATGAVPTAKLTSEMMNTLVGGLCYVAARYSATIYHVAPTEFAMIV